MYKPSFRHGMEPRASPEMYLSLLEPRGGAVAFYTGMPQMRGHGFFSNIATSFWPIIKKIGAAFLPHGLQMGADVLSDMQKGNELGSTLKTRGKTALKSTAKSLIGVSLY